MFDWRLWDKTVCPGRLSLCMAAGLWCEGLPRAGGACWLDSYQTDGIVCLNTWAFWCDPRKCVVRESHLLDVRTLVLREKPRSVICMVTLRCDRPGQRGEPGPVSSPVKSRGLDFCGGGGYWADRLSVVSNSVAMQRLLEHSTEGGSTCHPTSSYVHCSCD